MFKNQYFISFKKSDLNLKKLIFSISLFLFKTDISHHLHSMDVSCISSNDLMPVWCQCLLAGSSILIIRDDTKKIIKTGDSVSGNSKDFPHVPGSASQKMELLLKSLTEEGKTRASHHPTPKTSNFLIITFSRTPPSSTRSFFNQSFLLQFDGKISNKIPKI